MQSGPSRRIHAGSNLLISQKEDLKDLISSTPLWGGVRGIGVNIAFAIRCDSSLHERFSGAMYLVLGFGLDQRVGAD